MIEIGNDIYIETLTKNFILTIWFVCFALMDEFEMISITYFCSFYIPFMSSIGRDEMLSGIG